MGITMGNQVRLSGMMSGLDTDAIIKQLMKTQQVKYDKMFQTKTKAEWKRDAYNEVNSAIRKFRDEYASFLSNKNLLSSSAFKSYTVDMPPNGSLSVSVSSLAVDGAYTVSIDQLAGGATMTGDKASRYAEGFGLATVNNVAVKSIAGFASGEPIGDSLSFTVNGKPFSFSSSETLKSIMDKVNKSDAGVTMSYSQLTDSFKFETKAAGVYNPAMTQPVQPEFMFTYTGAAQPPNAVPEPGQGASATEQQEYEDYLTALKAYQTEYDTEYKQAMQAHQQNMDRYHEDLMTYRQNEARTLNVTDDSGFLKAIGMDVSTAARTDSREAVLTVNGVQITRDSNTFEVDGVNFRLTQPTAGDITFHVSRDVQKSVDLVKDFVSSYNALMEKLYGTLTEKKNYNYTPLTDEQRADLKDNEVALWDAKAKAGLLTRDPALQKLLDDMRSAFSSALGNDVFSSIGLSGSKYAAGTAHKIELNEAQLKTALEADPDRVLSMFTERVADAKGNIDFNASGLMYRLNTAVDRFSKTTNEINLKTLNESIREYENKMKTEDTRLYKVQERFYKQYAQLEAALAKMQSQTNAVTGLFSQQ